MNGAALAIDPVRYVHIITDWLMMSTELLHSVVIEAACALFIVHNTQRVLYMYLELSSAYRRLVYTS